MQRLRKLNIKQFLLIGIIIALLVAIPLTLILIQQNQGNQSHAAKSTVISFNTSDSPNNQTTTIGENVDFPIWIDPGSGTTANIIGNAKLEIKYDNTTAVSVDPTTCGFVANNKTLQEVGTPICSNGDITVILQSPPGDPNLLVQQPTQIGTMTFKAVAPGTVNITYGDLTQLVSSAPSSSDINGQDTEANVLKTTFPASLVVGGGSSPTPSEGVTDTPGPSVTQTDTPTPSTVETPTTAPTTAANVPACSSFTASANSGEVPLAVTFNATGSETNGNLTQATFNFGDGTNQTVAVQPTVSPTDTPAESPTPTTDNSGNDSLVTDTPTQAEVSPTTAPNGGPFTVSAAHTYNTAGTYQATAIFTDSNNQSSASTSCVATITVNAAGVTSAPVVSVVTGSPTLPSTGPAQTIMGLGLVGLILTIAGAAMFFIL